MTNLFNLDYLRAGTPIQQLGFKAIEESGVMTILREFHPVLAGTLPLDIFTERSDLDILCSCPAIPLFEDIVWKNFQHYQAFQFEVKAIRGMDTLIAAFTHSGFLFEIFAQSTPVTQQFAFRHLVKELAILEREGEIFKKKIIELKKSGMKTEPAFAKLLQLPGDPFQALLDYPLS